MRAEKPLKVLAVASPGGHWVQLRRLRPAWHGCEVVYATSNPGYRCELTGDLDCSSVPLLRLFPEASRWNRFRLLLQLIAVIRIVVAERPDAIVTTGASAGYFALMIGRWMGCRTIWVDSIANAEELSLAGRKAARYADVWLTQWEELAGSEPAGPIFGGRVL